MVGLATSNDAQANMTLTSMSTNGGHPRAGTPNYYLANNTDELVAALATITGQVRSCTFALSGMPPDPLAVKVQADGKTVPASATDGWGYNPQMTSVILTGSYCPGSARWHDHERDRALRLRHPGHSVDRLSF